MKLKAILLWTDVWAFLLFTGLALAFSPHTRAWWIGLLCLTPIQLVRMRPEDRAQAAFGDDYRCYRSQTWF